VADDHRNDLRLLGVVAFQGTRHLDVDAIIGVQEVGAHQEQNDVGRFELSIDRASPRRAWKDLAVVPCLDQPVALKHAQVLLELNAIRIVLGRVTEEDPKRPPVAGRLVGRIGDHGSKIMHQCERFVPRECGLSTRSERNDIFRGRLGNAQESVSWPELRETTRCCYRTLGLETSRLLVLR
jgi:hypothetical protein